MPLSPDLFDIFLFRTEQIELVRNTLSILSLWAIISISIGFIGGLINRKRRGSFWFHFLIMSGSWGLINLGIAQWGLLHNVNNEALISELVELWKYQKSLETTLLVNTILDIVYVMSGLLLLERSYRSNNPLRLKGFGFAIIVQASFLILFDLSFYLILLDHGQTLERAVYSLLEVAP
jgi:hypothetical protein